MKNFLTKFSPFLFPLILLLIGVGLRVYHWQTYAFGFDQVQILENAEKILKGDITLIGPRTGPAKMFTGPLIYYTTAALMLVVKTPYTIIPSTMIFAILTGVLLYWLGKRYLSQDKAAVILALWAFSPFLIVMDRIPWNPNLTIPAAALSFFPSYFLLKQDKIQVRKHWFDLGLIAAGTFLGFQAHFSALMLPALVILPFLWRRRFAIWPFLAASGGLALSLLPTVVFDMRNQWLNLRGFEELLHGTGSLPIDRLKELLRTVAMVSDNAGKIFFFDTNKVLVVIVGVAFFILYWWKWYSAKKKAADAQFFPLEWIVFSTLLFSIYQHNKPEYYYLLQVPAVLVILGEVIREAFANRKALFAAGFVFGLYGIFFTLGKYQENVGVSFGNQLMVTDFIRSVSASGLTQPIVYDTDAVHALGMQYLLRDIQTTTEGQVIHVQYPHSKGVLTTKEVSDLAVWIDPRNKTNQRYLTQPTYIIGSPTDIELHQVHYSNPVYGPGDIYKVWQKNQPQGDLVVISKQKFSYEFNEYEKIVKTQFGGEKSWTPITLKGTKAMGYFSRGHYFFFIPDTTATISMNELVAKLEVIN